MKKLTTETKNGDSVRESILDYSLIKEILIIYDTPESLAISMDTPDLHPQTRELKLVRAR